MKLKGLICRNFAASVYKGSLQKDPLLIIKFHIEHHMNEAIVAMYRQGLK